MSAPTGPTALSEGLRARVLERSLGRRPAGRATPEPPEITPVEALGRAARSMTTLLGELTEDQWRRTALRGLDVQGLVGHLIGVESDLQRVLAGDAHPSILDHIGSTQPAAEGQAGRPGRATQDAWTEAVTESIRALAAADPQARITLHGARLSVSELCIARTFELWTHENDIRGALGLAATQPDASTLTLMTRLATDLLVRVVSRSGIAGQDRPLTLRLVLTGPGGGTWQLTSGEPAAAPASAVTTTAVGIVADAVQFCRLVANRTTPAALEAHVTGDPGAAEAVLRVATTLALD